MAGMKMDLDGYLRNTESDYTKARMDAQQALDNSDMDADDKAEILEALDQGQREVRFLVDTIKFNIPNWKND